MLVRPSATSESIFPTELIHRLRQSVPAGRSLVQTTPRRPRMLGRGASLSNTCAGDRTGARRSGTPHLHQVDRTPGALRADPKRPRIVATHHTDEIESVICRAQGSAAVSED